MNCWEFKKCGREANGAKAKELGVCPAYPNHGTHCARIAGTLCGGKVQGVFATKLVNCMEYEFYKGANYDKTWRGYLLFLKTDLEYEWPRRTGLSQFPAGLLSLLTFGIFGRVLNRIRDKRSGGNPDVWPFFRRSDYDKALEQHPYLKEQ